jgi:hypothetical protein
MLPQLFDELAKDFFWERAGTCYDFGRQSGEWSLRTLDLSRRLNLREPAGV